MLTMLPELMQALEDKSTHPQKLVERGCSKLILACIAIECGTCKRSEAFRGRSHHGHMHSHAAGWSPAGTRHSPHAALTVQSSARRKELTTSGGTGHAGPAEAVSTEPTASKRAIIERADDILVEV